MATVTAFIRTTKKGGTGKVRVRFRLRDGASIQIFHVSEIEIETAAWDASKEEVKAKVIMPLPERVHINRAVAERKTLIAELYQAADRSAGISSAWLNEALSRRLSGEPADERMPQAFFDLFRRFIETRLVSEARKVSLRTVMHALERYERYRQLTTKGGDFTLSVATFSADTLRDFVKFMNEEPSLSKYYRELYEDVPAPKREGRGQNYMGALLSRLRTFFRWLELSGVSNGSPFKHFSIPAGVYGTPFYLTIEERNAVYGADFSAEPALAAYRDAFIFQCLTGCRVGDLVRLTADNIVGGAVEYIPRKTKEGRAVTVRVPLSGTAAEIIERYAGKCGGRLVPVRDTKEYNGAIRQILRRCGITRAVTVLNPTTREEEHRAICEVASSHIARRTFIGNLYKKVKDPALIGALSGHREGSTAFARYRAIDEDIKVELVRLLE